MLFSVSMFPVGDGDSLAEPIAEVVDEIDQAGLDYRVNGADTEIEGEWDEVVETIGRAERRLRQNHDRVYMVLTMDDHEGSRGRIRGAPDEVERALGRELRH